MQKGRIIIGTNLDNLSKAKISYMGEVTNIQITAGR